MKPKGRAREKNAKLPEGLEKRLGVYALAAAAAGAGMLGMAVPAQADSIVVESPSPELTAGPVGTAKLSINGKSVLKFSAWTSSGDFGYVRNGLLNVTAENGAGIMSPVFHQASLLSKGSSIGSKAGFRNYAILASNYSDFGSGNVGRNWANQTGYLGFEFLSNNEIHYGWAHLSVTANKKNGETATISEFGYDTVAGQSIQAGQTPVPEPGTLSLLALGAVGLFALRRKKLAGGN